MNKLILSFCLIVPSFLGCMISFDKPQKSIFIKNPPKGADEIFNLKVEKPTVYWQDATKITKYIQIYNVEGVYHRLALLYNKQRKQLRVMQGQLIGKKQTLTSPSSCKLVKVKKVKVTTEVIKEIFDFLEVQVKNNKEQL